MLTHSEYLTKRADQAIYNKWIDQFRMRNGSAIIPNGAVPPVMFGNEDRSAIEVYEWNAEPPERYVAYVKMVKAPTFIDGYPYGSYEATLTTWTGEPLGSVTFGRTWVSNFGDRRQAIRVRATNGRTYAGTYFRSAGNYARIRIVKGA